MTDRKKATIEESRYLIYSVYNNGDVTKASVKDPDNERPLPRYKDGGGVYVWVGKKKLYVKRLVAKHFMNEVGDRVECIDGNEDNCSVVNLRIGKRDYSSDRKIYTKVSVDGVVYDSISAAERALMVSHGYLTRYFNGQRSGKILEGHEIKIIKE